MLGKRLRHRKNARRARSLAAAPGLAPGQRRQPAVEPGKAFGRNRAVAARHGAERRIELASPIEAARDRGAAG